MFDHLVTHLLQPMALPCYLFLLTLPRIFSEIQHSGIPGRLHNRHTKPDEILKRALILLLIFQLVVQLFSSADLSEITTPEPD